MKLVLVLASVLVWRVSSAQHPQEKEQPASPPQPYSFSYIAGRYPGHVDRTHSETGDGSGHAYGSYAYVDPRFQVRKVDYVVDEQGFHPVLSIPVADTPTVAAAKHKHALLFQKIAEEHAQIAAERQALAGEDNLATR